MSSPSREKINLSPSSAKGHEVCVVGLACRYPGASTPREFWENILTLRPAFRPIPRERLNLDRYSEEAAGERDGTYATHAALLSGYDFDWRRNLVPKARFEVTDISHWLALDVAREAVADAGLDLAAADRSRIGVIIGNSLTGEVSRAEALRLRWPYVEEVLLRSGQAAGLDEGALRDLVAKARDSFKTPLAEPNEDWLAGVLSNVIAGRVCNALDLQGGGYTVDGACASSLLALKSGAEKIASGELDMVLAGGVDISIDPLELVGFSRAGALTRDRMRVYDQRSSGFIPGEGCGLALLMRRDLAEAGNYPIWADLDGWGVSSDGQGGVTAPKTETQALAMQRCYDLAGYSAKDLDFVEGHGTGTPLGDKVELGAILSQTGADEQAEPDAPLLPREIGVTSVKTLIGHTKAAAGMAGFLKAVLAVNQRILPPMAGLQSPNELFQTPGARIYPITQARAVAHDRRISAGISGAGFGGINCHVAVSASKENSRPALVASAQNLAASVQRAELVIASASDAAALSDRLEELADRANGMADGEFADFAARAADEDRNAPLRATFVSDDPRALSKGLRVLAAAARNEAPAPRGGK
ncbi:MAG: polyketide synthase, partial [Mangrovicoccus sp.]